MRLEEAGIFKALRVRAESRLYGSLVFKKNTAMYRGWIFIRLQVVSISDKTKALSFPRILTIARDSPIVSRSPKFEILAANVSKSFDYPAIIGDMHDFSYR